MGEKAPAYHEVIRVMELEQERFSDFERAEHAVPTRLPEVHLVQVGPPS
jgi:hypothetical protein